MKSKSFPEYCDYNNVPLQENMHDDLILKSAREFAREKVEQAIDLVLEVESAYDSLKFTKQEILSQLGLTDNEKKV